MTITINSYLKKGYIPLACNSYAGIAWQGDYINDLWMWNGKYTEYEGGIKHIQTIRVISIKDAALRYWRDNWVPLKGPDESLLRRLEQALREHPGLKKERVKFPDTPFLNKTEPIPEEFFGPEVRAYLGKKGTEKIELRREGEIKGDTLESYRTAKRGR
ncbi:MAG: hypothetical protein HYS21_13755 [Deltaproteobacteria bacterium]|nr:hypothetical protein [Deltaproteobacteria bacterium]